MSNRMLQANLPQGKGVAVDIAAASNG